LSVLASPLARNPPSPDIAFDLRQAVVDLFHSPPTRAPFSATERFINTTISASIKTANSQKQSTSEVLYPEYVTTVLTSAK
jgi:hypothetical protein